MHFAPGSAANAFRGAFGQILKRIACRPECEGAQTCPWRAECAYARLFEPVWHHGPSGFANAPRPFAIRAAALDGCRFPAGAIFPIDVHVFDLAEPVLEYLVLSFLQLASAGIGAGRRPVALRRVFALTASGRPGACVYEDGRGLMPEARTLIGLPLDAAEEVPVREAILRFRTPTELKSGGEVIETVTFRTVFARVRDRVLTIASLYGEPILDLDFRALSRRAAAVQTLSARLRWIQAHRRSTRTGQVHPLGGLVGEVHYAGELTEFMPILRVAYWTGIGRQTVWGKGVVEVDPVA
jgi:CRISPR-associated endoribonuclease Cas6